jgi:hypothetical protein
MMSLMYPLYSKFVMCVCPALGLILATGTPV